VVEGIMKEQAVEKRKRGRPAKTDTQPVVERKKKTAVIDPAVRRTNKHIIEDIIDYIEDHAGTLEKDHIKAQAALKKWSTRYYIYKNLISFFNIDDKTFDGENFK